MKQYNGFVSVDNPIIVEPSGSTIFPVGLYDAAGNPITSTGGALNVNATISSGPTNITQWNTVSVGSPSAYGTSPGAVNVIGVNAFITNIPHVIVDSGGGANASVGSTGAAAPTSATELGVIVAGNLVGQSGKTINEGSPASSVTSACVDIASVGGVGVSETGVLPIQPGAPTVSDWSSVAINFSSSGSNTVITGVANQTIRVMKIQYTVNGATADYFLDSGGQTFSGAYVFTGNGSAFSDSANGKPLFITSPGTGFQINSSVAVSTQGQVWFTRS